MGVIPSGSWRSTCMNRNVRVPSAASTFSLAAPSAAKAPVSGSAFLAALATAAQEGSSGSSRIVTGANALSEESASNGSANQNGDAPAPSIRSDGSTPQKAAVSQSVAGTAVTGQSSNAQENVPLTSGGSSLIARGASWAAASTEKNRLPSTQAAVVTSAVQQPIQTTSSTVIVQDALAAAPSLVASLQENAPLRFALKNGSVLAGGTASSTSDAAPSPGAEPTALPASPAAVSSSDSQASSQASSSGITLREMLASALPEQLSGRGSTEPDSGASADGSPAGLALPAASTARTIASPQQSSSGQGNTATTDDSSTGASAASINVHATTAVQNLPQQLLASRMAPDIAAAAQPALQPATPQKVRDQAAQAGPVAAAPGAAGTSSGSTDIAARISALSAGQAFVLPMDLPMFAAPGVTANSGLSASSGVEKVASSSSGSKNPLLAGTADTGTAKSTEGTSGPGDASSHSAQNSGQQQQNAQADSWQAISVAPRVIDSGASQVQAQAVAAHAPAVEIATAHSSTEVSNVASRPTGQQELPGSVHSEGAESLGPSSINTAKLMQSMSQSEMQVGMRSTEFGDISIRTSVSQQQMLAQISLSHSELSQAISAHVSSVQSKLGEEYGLHASIEVSNSGSLTSGDGGSSSQRDQRGFSQSAWAGNAAAPAEEETGLSLGAMVSTGNGNRLDIRA